MRILRVGGLTAALLLGLTLAATADVKPTYGQGGGLIGALFGSKSEEKPGEASVDKADSKAKDRSGDKAVPAGPSATEARAALERERKALLRRQAVCDRLRQIALDTADTELEQKADLLSQQAFTVFEERTAGLAAVVAEDKSSVRSGNGKTLPLKRRPADAPRSEGEDQ